jgi:hypothetical protein
MRPLPRLLLAAALTAVVASAAPAAASAAVRQIPVGISDQNAETFSNPLFAPLGMQYARYVTPWDVMADPTSYDAQQLDEWLTAARDAGVKPLISFNHSTGDDCPRSPCHKPTAAQYRKMFDAFLAKYPDVTTISPWNEANHMAQPTYKRPDLAALYYRVVKQACPTCTIVAADVLDISNIADWLTAFAKKAPDARLYGMHNYGDTNHFETDGIKTVLRTIRGNVWLTETGAITSFVTTSGKVSFKPSNARAAKAMNYLFKQLLPVSGRIKRVYLYHWGADPKNRWDSGLVDKEGKPRQVYSIVKAYSNPTGIPRFPVVTTPTPTPIPTVPTTPSPEPATPTTPVTPTVPTDPALPIPTVTLP